MDWNNEIKAKYHQFSGFYVAAYHQKIDCADLAIATLVEFAKKEGCLLNSNIITKVGNG